MTAAQKAAAKKNIKKAAAVAKKKRTVAHLPKATRTAMGKEGAKAAKRKRHARNKRGAKLPGDAPLPMRGALAAASNV
jgi:hypothetical protein